MAPHSTLAQPSPPDSTAAAPPFDAGRALLVFALLITALAYVNTARFQFVADDLPVIVNNPIVHSWQYLSRFFTQHVWAQQVRGPGDYYRPIFMIWLVLNHTLFGLNPAGWHLTNLAAHLVATWLVYLLGVRLTQNRLAGAMAAVIFGLHPTHIESVAWVCGITDPLMAVFALGSVLAYLRGREAEDVRVRWFAGSVALYALAVFTKETAVMLPAVLLAYEYIYREPRRPWLRAAVLRILPLAAVTVVYLAMRHMALQGFSHPEPDAPTALLATLPGVLWFYVWHLLWPFGLSLFYESHYVTHATVANCLLPLVGVVAAVIPLAWAAKRSRAAAFAAAWMGVFLVPPLLGLRVFVREDLVHDRYLYMSVAGLAFLLALVIGRLKLGHAELFGQPAAQVGVVAALALVLGWGTASQNVYWATDLTLFAHSVKMSRNVLAIDHLANEMYKRGQNATALDLYRQALQVSPGHWQTRFALGVTQFDLGNMEEAERELDRATQIRNDNANQYYFLGVARMKLGRLPEAEQSLRRGIAIYSAGAGFHLALGAVLEQEGNLAGARDEYRAELANGPNPVAQQRLAALEGRRRQ
jgi:tetratricopeptide (TPR) repeat protein